MSRVTATPECSKTIHLDTDKLEQIPCPSCYPLEFWSVSFSLVLSAFVCSCPHTAVRVFLTRCPNYLLFVYLKKVTGRVWGFLSALQPVGRLYPCPHWVPLIHLQRRHAPHRHEKSLLAKEEIIQKILLAHRDWQTYYVLLHGAKLGHGTDSFTSPRKEGMRRIFQTSAGFEPANSGTRGQHANH